MINQWGVGMASPHSLGPLGFCQQKGEPAGGGCSTQAWEQAWCQVQLVAPNRADLHFTLFLLVKMTDKPDLSEVKKFNRSKLKKTN